MAGGHGAGPDVSDRLDSLGMFDIAAAFPEQVADAVAVGEAVGPGGVTGQSRQVWVKPSPAAVLASNG